MQQDNLLESVLDASKTVPPVTFDFVFYKLIEEIGEMAKAHNQPERCDESFWGEFSDVMNSLIDLGYRKAILEGASPGDDAANYVQCMINNFLPTKISKWIINATGKVENK